MGGPAIERLIPDRSGGEADPGGAPVRGGGGVYAAGDGLGGGKYLEAVLGFHGLGGEISGSDRFLGVACSAVRISGWGPATVRGVKEWILPSL